MKINVGLNCQKIFLHLDKESFLVNVNDSPANSSYIKKNKFDIFTTLMSQLRRFDKSDIIIIR